MPWRVGIDENGLGPTLGPLLVTAVLAEVTPSAARKLERDGTAYLHERLNDSKLLVNHHDIALGEAWARVVCERLGHQASVPSDIVGAISLRDERSLQRQCSPVGHRQCWDARTEAFEAGLELVSQVREDMQALADAGIDVRWAKADIVCVKQLNDLLLQDRNRLAIDLAAMEQLVLEARRAAGHDVVAICGKVGGLTRYLPRLTRLRDYPQTVVTEGPACSRYRFGGVGDVSFARDADSADPLVALASLVGKYLRELLMRRIVSFYQSLDSQLENVSGYNDPLTAVFIESTASFRTALKVPSECFQRRQAGRG